MLSRRSLLSAAGSIVVLCTAMAGAAGQETGGQEAGSQQAGKPKVFLFNIPAQPLQSALITYAGVVGRQIMYDPKSAKSLRSHAVTGLFTADTGLRMLITGTDLTIVPTGTDVALVPWATIRANQGQGHGQGTDGEAAFVLDTLYVSVAPGAEERPDLSEYGRLVRSQILKTLSNDPKTAKHIFNARIDIWVGPSGAITEARMTRSSGMSTFDAVLRQVVEGITVSRAPPDGMRQPIHVTVIGV